MPENMQALAMPKAWLVSRQCGARGSFLVKIQTEGALRWEPREIQPDAGNKVSCVLGLLEGQNGQAHYNLQFESGLKFGNMVLRSNNDGPDTCFLPKQVDPKRFLQPAAEALLFTSFLRIMAPPAGRLDQPFQVGLPMQKYCNSLLHNLRQIPGWRMWNVAHAAIRDYSWLESNSEPLP